MNNKSMEKYQGFLQALDNTDVSDNGFGTEREMASEVFRQYHIFNGDIIESCCQGYESFVNDNATRYMAVHFVFCPFCGEKTK